MAAYQHGDAHGSADSDTDVVEPTQPLPRLPRERRGRFRRFLYRLTLTVASLLACAALGFGLLLVFTPSAGEAQKLAAQLAREHHIAYPGPPAPANFSRPLIATEDHRFYSEVGGIDPVALGRVAQGTVTGGPDGGGATIDLQLATMLYIGADSPEDHTIAGKLKEVALAVKLGAMYSRPEILRLYAEVAYYGHGYYGLQAASCGYFGHPVAELTIAQGAMLAGVVNAPALDDPIDHPAQAHARLAHVIGRMVAVGDLTPAQGQAALSTPLHLTPGHSPAC